MCGVCVCVWCVCVCVGGGGVHKMICILLLLIYRLADGDFAYTPSAKHPFYITQTHAR